MLPLESVPNFSEGRDRATIDAIGGALGEHARILVEMRYTEIKQGELIDTYARSAFEDTRRKAAKFGAMGSTIRATKPR